MDDLTTTPFYCLQPQDKHRIFAGARTPTQNRACMVIIHWIEMKVQRHDRGHSIYWGNRRRILRIGQVHGTFTQLAELAVVDRKTIRKCMDQVVSAVPQLSLEVSSSRRNGGFIVTLEKNFGENHTPLNDFEEEYFQTLDDQYLEESSARQASSQTLPKKGDESALVP